MKKMNFLNIALTIHDIRFFISIELDSKMSQKRRLGIPGSGATAANMIMLLSLAAS